MNQPPTEKATHKLSHEQQVAIVQKIACYERDREIQKWLKAQGLNLNRSNLDHYRNSEHWKPLVEKFRKEFDASISSIPLASKAKRVFELDQAFLRARKIEDESKDPSKKLDAIDLQMTILTKAQGELEGKQAVEQNNIYFTQFNSMDRKQFDEFRLKLVNRVQAHIAKEQTEEAQVIDASKE